MKPALERLGDPHHTSILWVDIETRSRLDLKKTNPYVYAADLSTEIILCSYAFDDEPVRVLQLADWQLLSAALQDPLVLKVAHAAGFDRVVFSAKLGMPVGTYLPPADWADSMALAAQWACPFGLGPLSEFLGVTEKMPDGRRLIQRFSRPVSAGKRKGEWNDHTTHPEDWNLFTEYARVDVVAMRDCCHSPTMPGWMPGERDLWIASEVINDHGVLIDAPMVEAAELSDLRDKAQKKRELESLLGIQNGRSVQQVQTALAERGLVMDSLDKDSVAEALGRDLSPELRRALELRSEISYSSASKFKSARERVNSDGRVRGGFFYHQGSTGRFGGRRPQFQNLPSATHKDPEGAIRRLLAGETLPGDELKSLTRAMIPDVTSCDYGQIEARVQPWLYGASRLLESFLTEEDHYVGTARRMGDMTGKEIKGTEEYVKGRKSGKVAALALSYAGWVPAYERAGGSGTYEQMSEKVMQFRRAHHELVDGWHKLQFAFQYGGKIGPVGLEVIVQGANRLLKLPSGRYLVYRSCQFRPYVDKYGRDKVEVTYMAFDNPKFPKGVRTIMTPSAYPNHVTQATARDLLRHALVNMVKDGKIPSMHIHDEVVAEGHAFWLERYMLDAPAWAKGLPLAASADYMPRYRKD